MGKRALSESCLWSPDHLRGQFTLLAFRNRSIARTGSRETTNKSCRWWTLLVKRGATAVRGPRPAHNKLWIDWYAKKGWASLIVAGWPGPACRPAAGRNLLLLLTRKCFLQLFFQALGLFVPGLARQYRLDFAHGLRPVPLLH